MDQRDTFIAMAEPKRIIVKRGDDVASVVEQLIDAEGDSVVFAIAPGALFGQTVTNFKLVKREASLLRREVVVETADLAIRERAAKAGLGILEAAVSQDDGAVPVAKTRRPAGKRSVKVSVVDDEETAARRPSRAKKAARPEPDEESEAEEVPDGDGAEPVFPGEVPERVRRGEPQRPAKKKHRGLLLWVSIAAVIGIGVVWYVAAAVLPKATITVVTEKKTWNFDGNVSVDKALAKVDPIGARVPGQVFVIKDSVTKRVPVSGKQFVNRKATGTMTVYNAYSSQPQTIVANTRFVTPGGVIFRITSGLTIPGAQITNGKITPSSIEVAVAADKPGVAGNVGPTPRLSIPGFAKTPKYDGFYGELKEGASGGFSGETSVPTDKDVAAAKKESADTITASLNTKVSSSVPAGFTVLAGASRVSVTKQTIESVADAAGTVGVVTEAQLSILAFRDADVKSLLQDRVTTAVGPDFKVDTETLTYGALNPKAVALASGKMLVVAKYNVSLSRIVTPEAVSQQLAGKPDDQLNTLIFAIPGITGGKVELWPFYVHTVPSAPEKITVVVQ